MNCKNDFNNLDDAFPTYRDGGSNDHFDLADLSNINVEDVAFHDYDLGDKYKGVPYRSVEVESLHLNARDNEHFDAPMMSFGGPPKLSKSAPSVPIAIAKGTQMNSAMAVCDDLCDFEFVSESLDVPEKPFLLLCTHFVCVLGLSCVMQIINERLQKTLELSMQYSPTQHKWNAVYLRGSSTCKIEIRLYKEDEESFIVEVNRLSGDSIVFRSLYNELKSDFSAFISNRSEMERASEANSVSSHALPPLAPLSDYEIIASLRPVLEMVNSVLLDVREQGCQILCDICAQEDIHHILASSGCVKELICNVIAAKSTEIKNFAVCALAAVSSSQTGLDCIFECMNCVKLTQELFSCATDGCYETAEMRRECSRILKNLCKEDPCKVKEFVEESQLHDFINCVDSLQDDRLRLHAECAKDYLMALRRSFGFLFFGSTSG